VIEALALALAAALAACGSAPGGSAADGGGGSDAAARDGNHPADAGPIGGDRPVSVYVPPSYVAGTAMPLVILLHGYSLDGALEEEYVQLQPLAASRGFLYAHPDGLVDSLGNHYWNATDACCDFDHAGTDDSGYISRVIADIAAAYTVDPKRVFLVGHSDGGFLSHRVACDHGDQIAAFASLAGAMWEDPSKCPAQTPVAALEIHGTADAVIAYAGGLIDGVAFPGAATTIGDWITADGCSSTAGNSAPLDLDAGLPGDETAVTTYSGCRGNGHAELWTIAGGSHIPTLSATFTADVVDFLFAHPKS
jgi:polyhydroxybutyrate depolymerase